MEQRQEETRSNRERAIERLKSRKPDIQADDDEALWGQVNDDYDGYEKELSGYRENEKSLTDMFGSDPRSARFLTAWHKGGDPVVELVRMYGDDVTEAAHDPEKLEEIAKANKEFVERVAKEKELEDTYQTNLEQSIGEIEKIQADEGLTDDEVDAAMSWLVGIIGDGVKGKFAPETIRLALKAQNYDTDVADAGHEGELRGRNAKIMETLRKPKQGDGVSMLGGRNGGTGGGRASSIFSLANEAR